MMPQETRAKPSASDPLSRIPRYLQVATALRHRINCGQWAVGEKIATLEQLENEFRVARVTVRQAVELLQQEGLLRSEQGRGTFVTQSSAPGRWLQLATDWESLILPIKRNKPKLLVGDEEYKPRIREEDGAAVDEYAYIYSQQLRDDAPYALARVLVDKRIYDRAPDEFRTRVGLAVLVEMEDVPIARAHQTLSIGSADGPTTTYLGLSYGSPIVEARCVVTDPDDQVIYLGEISYRGDVVQINIELLKNGR